MNKKTKKRLRELEQQVSDLRIEMLAFDRSVSVAIGKAREDAIAYVVQLAKEGSLCDNPAWARKTAPGEVEQSLRNQIAGLHDD